jgi:ABC-2 type transport system ATP-binding protein
MIRAQQLSKTFGRQRAVEDLSFEVTSGKVTGFLGPNGAGKSTTLRMIMGLDRPTSGSVTIDGLAYRDLPSPMRKIGALLDAKAVEGSRTARKHLEWMARAGAVPLERIDEVLDMTGLLDVAGKRVGGFSLGMHQRLGIAAALLGDPEILVLDEPVNGLDPEGIRWVRELMRSFAAGGRTVLVSSHLMSEMERTADHVLVIGSGRLIADAAVDEFVTTTRPREVDVLTPNPEQLTTLLEANGGVVERLERPGSMRVTGIDNIRISELAVQASIAIHELTPRHSSLESRFMELTYDSVDYRSKDQTTR